MNELLKRETERRRTFAIIAHPDAGKTTLTEKLLLYGGAIQLAGAVKARKERRSATSDWMAMEKERGISITSAALQFEYKNYVLNLLDTPGHEDFSEDTYRTLIAADCAVMVLDAAKGVEPQTRKLFKVCKERGIPIITFVNKMDRPNKELFGLLDEIEEVLGITAIPMVWPIGGGLDFRGVYDRNQKEVHLFEKTPGGAYYRAPVQVSGIDDPKLEKTIDLDILKKAREEIDLIDSGLSTFDRQKFELGNMTPVFFGSAVNNFGIQLFLDNFLNLAPAPYHIPMEDGNYLDPINSPFSCFVFKVQANMNKVHRDRIAFVRICSGRFERGLTVNHNRLDKQIKLSSSFAFFGQDRNTIDEAFPGDIIGLVNPGTYKIGDILSSGPTPPLKPLPVFPPELFATVSCSDSLSLKSFKKGIEQLSEEGILHVYTSRQIGSGNPIIGAMGQLQFEVFQRRLLDEYNAKTNLTLLPYEVCRWVKKTSIPKLPSSVNQIQDKDGNIAVMFEGEWEFNYFVKNNPEIELVENPTYV
jgi:peptide chain release factor 3